VKRAGKLCAKRFAYGPGGETKEGWVASNSAIKKGKRGGSSASLEVKGKDQYLVGSLHLPMKRKGKKIIHGTEGTLTRGKKSKGGESPILRPKDPTFFNGLGERLRQAGESLVRGKKRSR